VLFVTASVAALYRPAPRIERGKLEVTAIDVGQGDSLLIVSPEGRTICLTAAARLDRFEENLTTVKTLFHLICGGVALTIWMS